MTAPTFVVKNQREGNPGESLMYFIIEGTTPKLGDVVVVYFGMLSRVIDVGAGWVTLAPIDVPFLPELKSEDGRNTLYIHQREFPEGTVPGQGEYVNNFYRPQMSRDTVKLTGTSEPGGYYFYQPEKGTSITISSNEVEIKFIDHNGKPATDRYVSEKYMLEMMAKEYGKGYRDGSSKKINIKAV